MKTRMHPRLSYLPPSHGGIDHLGPAGCGWQAGAVRPSILHKILLQSRVMTS
jgi:hypothetical protein